MLNSENRIKEIVKLLPKSTLRILMGNLSIQSYRRIHDQTRLVVYLDFVHFYLNSLICVGHDDNMEPTLILIIRINCGLC